MTAEPRNPFRSLRERMGITQYALAERAGVTKHAVLRLEQACYYEPLPSVISYFLRQYPDLSRPYLLKEYERYQIHVRYKNSMVLGDLRTLAFCPVGIHPLQYLLINEDLNPTSLAKKLCISQSTLVHFIKNASNQLTVPEQLIEALHDADYSSDETDYLVRTYEAYRRWLRAEKRLTLVPKEEVETSDGSTGAVAG